MKGLIFVLLLGVVVLTSGLNLKNNGSVERITPKLQSRITNGLTAKNGQFNFQVGLKLRWSFWTSNWCGGSLISAEWILTAAHCVDKDYTITAYLGSTTKQSGKKVKVIEKIIHSGWNPETMLNDIALLRIPTVTLRKNIDIVNLPPLTSVYPELLNEKVIASGWGYVNDKEKSVKELQYANMEIVSNSVCYSRFGPVVTSSNICVQGPKGTSICSGDSGGPLITESTRTLVGLSSFVSVEGCSLDYPQGFTRIASYRSWILEKTGI